MPVLIDEHDASLSLRPGTTKSAIVAYLYRNAQWGYSPSEISERLSIPRGTATTTLNRLAEEGYVGNTDDGYYYAIDDRADVRRYVSSLDQVERLFGHHRADTDTLEAPPEQTGDAQSDAEIADELDALEAELDDERDGYTIRR